MINSESSIYHRKVLFAKLQPENSKQGVFMTVRDPSDQ